MQHDNEDNHLAFDSFLKVSYGEYNILDAYIIGTFVESEYQQLAWTVEVQIDSGPEVFEAFNGIIIPNVSTIENLSFNTLEHQQDLLSLVYYESDLANELGDLYSISFDEYDYETNQIPCTIEATSKEGSEYFLQANLEFRGYYYFTKNKNSVNTFVNDYLGYDINEVEIEYEKQENGYWLCIIF